MYYFPDNFSYLAVACPLRQRARMDGSIGFTAVTIALGALLLNVPRAIFEISRIICLKVGIEIAVID
jgi:hypothetical protein